MTMTRRLARIALLALACSSGLFAAEKLSTVRFIVLKDNNGKPVRNASVILHPMDEGKQKRNGLELKADGEGKCSFDGLPYGKWRIQVLARGLQTYGEDYDIAKDEMEITIKLKTPQEQYSIYKDNPAPSAGGDKDKSDKKDTPKPDAPKADAPKADVPKTDPPKSDPPNSDPAKSDLPKTDAPKRER